MTILLDDESSQPGTHVLLVGVGGYPALNDGPEDQRFEMPMGLGDLDSPQHSVALLHDWFTRVDGFNNPNCPLRSMAALCSPLQLEPRLHLAGQPLHPADAVHVDDAVRAWEQRASRNQENICLFYFCGHGLNLSERNQALLLSDFGFMRGDPMRGAIAFNDMRQGLMEHCAARHQAYIIDACRTLPATTYLERYGTKAGAEIFSAGINALGRGKNAPILQASSLGAAAYSREAMPSTFAQALVDSFEGSAGSHLAGRWVVAANALAAGVNACLQAALANELEEQVCQSLEAAFPLELHVMRNLPAVPVKVYTKDLSQLASTVLSYEHNVTKGGKSRAPAETPWWTPINFGAYHFRAVHAGTGVETGIIENHLVYPPLQEIAL